MNLIKTEPTKERWLNNDDLAQLFMCSTQTIARMTKEGRLPQPVRFSKKMVRWRESDVTRFILERKASYVVSQNY